MTANGYLQLALYLVALIGFGWPLGLYMARVYRDELPGFVRWLKPVERGIYRICGIKADDDMPWTRYAFAALAFNLMGLLAVYALQRLQGALPLNPEGLAATTADLAFNTAVSFATNTNWQSYGGETTMSYLTQMLGLTVQNFVSAASGMAVLVALMRGFVRKEANGIGNFWVDMTRSTLYILLPLSLALSIALVGQGVVQTFEPHAEAELVHPTAEAQTQAIAVGPAASQVAIKQLGTNGGGFFNVNSAHPLRESDAAVELPRAAVHPDHSGGAVLHLRQVRRRHAPGWRDPRRHDRRLRRAAGAVCRRRAVR